MVAATNYEYIQIYVFYIYLTWMSFKFLLRFYNNNNHFNILHHISFSRLRCMLCLRAIKRLYVIRLTSDESLFWIECSHLIRCNSIATFFACRLLVGRAVSITQSTYDQMLDIYVLWGHWTYLCSRIKNVNYAGNFNRLFYLVID